LPDWKHDRWPRAAALVAVGLAVLAFPLGCQRSAPGSLSVATAASETGSVRFTINVPRKVTKAVRQLLAAGNESSTLLVNQVQVSLSGPGFYAPVYPEEGKATQGEMPVQSGSINSQFLTVPTGKNRFIKVVAKNGKQKLNQVAGVLDVQPGPYNHVIVGLSTTPTAHVIEKLALKAPEAARGFSAPALQRFIDTHITRPKAEPQNTFDGVHPYMVNTDGLVDHLIANDYTLPTDFDPSREADRAFVLNAGTVRVTLDQALPAGSRVWLNDPTSAILEVATYDAAQRQYEIPNIAPNFERVADDLAAPAWTLTIMTPDGRLTSVPVAIARKPLSEGALPRLDIDLSNSLKTIKRIFLSPTDGDWAGTAVAINGRRVQQLFVYAVYDDTSGEQVVPLLPNTLTWESLDATRLKVGNGGTLDGARLDPALLAADPNLAGATIEDYGLVYPLAETDATTPKARIKGTMKGNPALTATVDFTVGHLGADTGRVQVAMAADGIYVAKPDGIYVPQLEQTLTAMFLPATLSVVENGAPAGTTYAWKCDNPLIRFGAPEGPSVAVSAIGPLPSGQYATATVFSSTGRTATARIRTAFVGGGTNVAVGLPAETITFDALSATNATNNAFTPNAGYPLGGYLNVFAGQATLQATDSADANAKFFFRSSDPFTTSVSGVFPSRSCTLTALRRGTVTITLIDQNGRTIQTEVRTVFDKTGGAGLTVSVPGNGIALTPASPTVSGEAALQAALTSLGATATAAATESGVAAPRFTWKSLTPFSLAIEPPAGESFPNARATLKALRRGAAQFQLVSAQTGESQIITLNLNFSVTNGAGTSVTLPSLVVKQIDPAPTYGTSQEIVVKTLGAVVTLLATDPDDPGGTFVWTPDDEHRASLVDQANGTARFRLLDYGPTAVRVVNTRTGRWGWLNFDVRKTGAGTGTIHVTL
jgi:hypothetical protein